MEKSVLSIFVSAVSKEFGSHRKEVATLLRKKGYQVRIQEEFTAGSGTLLEKLDKFIQSCDAVVCIIGDRFGAAPRESESAIYSDHHYSYTQYEYLLARKYGKRVFVFYPDSAATPRDESLNEPEELTHLQEDFVTNEIHRKGVDRTPFSDLNTLAQAVLLCDFETTKQKVKTHVDCICPYVGLKRFEANDHDYFFGRTATITHLENVVQSAPLLLVTGDSGSGKSSLIRAGLIPSWIRKQKRKGFPDPKAIIFTPGSSPFDELWAGMLAAGIRSEDAAIARKPNSSIFQKVLEVIPRVRGETQPCLFFIDQFEELFTRVSEEDSDLKEAFVDSIVALAKRLQEGISNRGKSLSVAPVHIILAMRDDFFGKLGDHKALCQFTDQNLERVREMDSDELREVIEIPAQKHGVRFEEGLVRRIIKAVQGQAGMLPLLQYTLEALWQEERENANLLDGVISIGSYKNIGGVEGALQKRVSSYYDSKSDSDKTAIRQMLLSMVDPGGGKEAIPVSQAAEKETLLQAGGEKLLRELLDKEKLLISKDKGDRSVVELAHETLIRSWPEFEAWVRDNREVIKIRNQLKDDAEQWASKSGVAAEADLWRGSRLERAIELGSEGELDRIRKVSELEKNFLEAAKNLKTRELRRTQILLLISATVAVLAVALAYVAYRAEEKADRNLANANLEIAKAWKERSHRYEDQKEYFSASVSAAKGLGYLGFGRSSADSEFLDGHPMILDPDNPKHALTRQELFLLTSRNIVQIPYWKTVGHSVEISSLSWNPAGTILASGSSLGETFLWNSKGEIIANIGTFPYKKRVTAIEWAPNGTAAVFCFSDDDLWIVDDHGTVLFAADKFSRKTSDIAWSPDSRSFAIACDSGGEIFIYKTERKNIGETNEQPDRIIPTSASGVLALNWESPLLAVAGNENLVMTFNANSPKETRVALENLQSGEKSIDSLAWDLESGTLNAYSNKGSNWHWKPGEEKATKREYASRQIEGVRTPDRSSRVILREHGHLSIIPPGGEETPLSPMDKRTTDFALSPDKNRRAAAMSNGSVSIWNQSGEIELSARLEEPASGAFSWNPATPQLAWGGQNGTIGIIDTDTQEKALIESYHDPITSLAWSQEGSSTATPVLAVGSFGGNVKILRLADGDCIATWRTPHDHPCFVQWSRKNILTVVSIAGTVELRELDGRRIRQIEEHEGGAVSAAWNHQGDFLAIGSHDGAVYFYDPQGNPVGKAALSSPPHKANHITLLSAHPTKNEFVFCDETHTLFHLRADHHSESVEATITEIPRTISAPIATLQWSPSLDQFAYGTKTGELGVIAIKGSVAREIFTDKRHTAILSTLAWSPDGELLSSASWDKSVVIRNPRDIEATPKKSTTLEAETHKRAVSCLSWSPDGTILAAGSWDGTISLRDKDGNVFGNILSHTDAITDITWSPDGGLLTSASGDGQVRTFQVDQSGHPYLATYLEKDWIEIIDNEVRWQNPGMDPSRSGGWARTILKQEQSGERRNSTENAMIFESSPGPLEGHYRTPAPLPLRFSPWEFKNSANENLTMEMLRGHKTKDDLYIPRNEIYARRGLIFGSSKGLNMISKLPSNYYIGVSTDAEAVEERFNEYEGAARDLIVTKETEIELEKN